MIDDKTVATMIRAHYEKDEARFANLSREVAEKFQLRNKTQLASYVRGLVGDERTFVPMGEELPMGEEFKPLCWRFENEGGGTNERP